MKRKLQLSFGMVIALLIIIFGALWHYKNHPFPNGKCAWNSQCAPLIEQGGMGDPICVESECRIILKF